MSAHWGMCERDKEAMESYKTERDWLDSELGKSKARVRELEEALTLIADMGHELDGYEMPPKLARKIARAALEKVQKDSS